jgi:hypothetical protein
LGFGGMLKALRSAIRTFEFPRSSGLTQASNFPHTHTHTHTHIHTHTHAHMRTRAHAHKSKDIRLDNITGTPREDVRDKQAGRNFTLCGIPKKG